MSIGTIVVIVLSMTMLILGLVLIRQIFTSGTDVVKMTNDQLVSEVGKLFSQDDKVVIYPQSRLVEVKQGIPTGVGIGIKNLLGQTSGISKFSYTVKVSDVDLYKKCKVEQDVVESWITTGRAEEGIEVASGDLSARKVLFAIPVGSPLCTIRFSVTVHSDQADQATSYASDYFDITIKSAK